jgi:hypothetical protein
MSTVTTQTPRTSRADHLAWCKRRALEYIDKGDVQGAFASMASDLNKHPDTEGHIGLQLGMAQLLGGMLNSPAAMRHFIDGFN